ncbi:hypothetical protein AAFN60_21255 [Roseibacillus persicicus]|uniref:hypothetical protein n=1 Tax=Roseibacillus persicicus TaxID=454148 RepID=UPI00398AE1AB
MSDKLVQNLTTKDPAVFPKLKIRELRSIVDVKEGETYKVIPEASGLKGFQTVEFIVRRKPEGMVEVELTWVDGKSKKVAGTIGSFEHLVVELRGKPNEDSLFCAIDVREFTGLREEQKQSVPLAAR